MREEILSIASDLREGSMTTSDAKEQLLLLFSVSESLPSDDEIKLTNNGFGSLEEAIKKANCNVR